ncbi:MHS family MFS transporter [Rothia sp. AR01]|uniref:MHS family MFS transporter n=1 Tax=Rothia santali TaxID=2949643 RepID=A0A9X2HAR7_9MICC|nr:MFS transporter [Rothia santali]MCP3424770.1 MHS family MFS transporter [Rothia santali]
MSENTLTENRPPANAAEAKRSSPVRVLGSAFAGTTIEWYDFYLYGIAAAIIFNNQYFHSSSPLVALLASFATLAVGVVVRPIGGILAGHIGDRVGRKVLLVGSLLTMGISSTLIGALPNYDAIGILAPVGLVVLRVFQGLSAGAEWGGSALLSVEHAPPRRRGFFGSFTQIGSAGGMLLATGSYAIVQAAFTDEQFAAFGWRLPFLASGLLVAVALVIRLGVTDAREFKDVKEAGAVKRAPVISVIKDHPRALLVTIFLRVAQNGIYYLVTVYLLTYLKETQGGSGSVLTAVMIASAIGLFSGPVWGLISDRVGRRPVSLFGYVAIGVFGWLIFIAADAGAFSVMPLIIVLGLVFAHDSVYGPQAAWFAEQFPVEVRYSGVSMGYQIGTLVGGGLMPFIATLLYAWGGETPWLIVAYLSVLVVISVIAALLAVDPARAEARAAAATRPGAETSPADAAAAGPVAAAAEPAGVATAPSDQTEPTPQENR